MCSVYADLIVGRGIDIDDPWPWGPWMSQTGRWACPLLCVTFDLLQLLFGACQEVKGEAMAVNKADYTCADCGAGGKATKM